MRFVHLSSEKNVFVLIWPSTKSTNWVLTFLFIRKLQGVYYWPPYSTTNKTRKTRWEKKALTKCLLNLFMVFFVFDSLHSGSGSLCISTISFSCTLYAISSLAISVAPRNIFFLFVSTLHHSEKCIINSLRENWIFTNLFSFHFLFHTDSALDGCFRCDALDAIQCSFEFFNIRKLCKSTQIASISRFFYFDYELLSLFIVQPF